MRGDRRSLAIVLVVFVGLLLCTLVGAPAHASDKFVVFEFEDREYEAAPGETVELDLLVYVTGSAANQELESAGVTISVDDSVASIVDVEHGEWFEDGSAVEVDRSATVRDGSVTVHHERVTGAASAHEPLVTVTIRIDEDAPPSDLVVRVTDTTAGVAAGKPARTISRPKTVVVDGGGPTIAPGVEDDSSDHDDGPAVTTAEEIGREVDSSIGDDDDPTPPLGVLAGGVAFAGGVTIALVVGTVVAARRVR